MIWTFEWMAAREGVNQDCIKANPDNEWRCFFAQYTAPHIKTPIFPLQAIYDSWQIPNDLGTNEPAQVNLWGRNLHTYLNDGLLRLNPNNGVFLDSCFHHCGAWGDIHINGKNQVSTIY